MSLENQEKFAALQQVIDELKDEQGALMPIMQRAQDIFGYLPEDVQHYIAKALDIPVSDVYGVATFYAQFNLEPKGKYIIKVCDGTACHVRKSMPVKEAMLKELGLSHKKHTTDDMMFTVETVSCLGACGLAPTLTVNDEVHPKMTPEKAVELLNELRGESV